MCVCPHIAVAAGEPCVASLLLENPGQASHTVAFKVKTTMPDRYLVAPSMGLLPPGTSLRIEVTLDSTEAQGLYQRVLLAGPNMPPLSDKFLVQVRWGVRGMVCIGTVSSHPAPGLQTAPIEADDLSTSDRVLHLGTLWGTSRWKRKIRNKKLLTRMIARVEVSSDESETEESGGTAPSEDMCVNLPPPLAVAGGSSYRLLCSCRFRDSRTVQSATRSSPPVGGAHVPFSVPPSPTEDRFATPQTGARAVTDAAVASGGALHSSSDVALPLTDATGVPTLAIGGGGRTFAADDGAASSLAERSQSTLAALLRPGGASDGKFGGRLTNLALADSNFDAPTPTFPWRKGELVGAGQSGRVYKALRMDTGKLVAVKVIETSSKRQQKLLEREVMVMKLLKHPNIVRYLGSESGIHDLCPVVNVFMEYCQGGSIMSLLKKFGPLSEQVVQVYTKQILRGLRYLHGHGYVVVSSSVLEARCVGCGLHSPMHNGCGSGMHIETSRVPTCCLLKTAP